MKRSPPPSSLLRTGSPVALTATLLGTLSGCSFIFTQGPPAQHEQMPYFDCSSSYAPPVLDTIWGSLNGLGALSAATTSDADWHHNYSRGQVVASGLIWLGISGASAIYGYNKVSQCAEAKEELAARSMRQPAPRTTWQAPPAPPPYTPPSSAAPPAPAEAPPPSPPAAAPPAPPAAPPSSAP